MRARTLPLEIVVAMDQERGIGKDRGLPWRLPGDMAHFRELTSGAPGGRTNAVVMGRRTWESIPDRFRPLRQRRNVVLTRNDALVLPAPVVKASSLADALAHLDQAEDLHRIFVIGGAELYASALALERCTRVYITCVAAVFGCDTFLPELGARFRRREKTADVPDGEHLTHREVYERVDTVAEGKGAS